MYFTTKRRRQMFYFPIVKYYPKNYIMTMKAIKLFQISKLNDNITDCIKKYFNLNS